MKKRAQTKAQRALRRRLKKRSRTGLRRPAILMALAALGILIGIWASLWRLGVAPALPFIPVPAPTRGYGFSGSFVGWSPTQLNHQFGGMQSLGAQWVRFDLDWSLVQPSSTPTYDWSATDAVVRAASAHNLHVLMILDFSPTWARSAACRSTKFCLPADSNTYASFAAAAVAHYQKMGVHDWEIWNEPNIAFRFRPAADPVEYTDLLKAAYKSIKQVDKHATVVAGSMAPSATGDGNYSPLDFASGMYEAQAQNSFDALSIHPYTYPKLPSQTGPEDAWGQMSLIHSLMASNGDGDKKIWITEFGAPTNGPDESGDHVSEAAQAQMATQAISKFRQYLWSGPFFWYEYQDDGTSSDTSENFYGLVRADGSHKPAYEAFKQAVAAHQ